jgi:hypothetical protein
LTAAATITVPMTITAPTTTGCANRQVATMTGTATAPTAATEHFLSGSWNRTFRLSSA